jgi:hypothetical protein
MQEPAQSIPASRKLGRKKGGFTNFSLRLPRQSSNVVEANRLDTIDA